MNGVTLVGLGVVGQAILHAHLEAGFRVRVMDVNEGVVEGLSVSLTRQLDQRSLVEPTESPCESLHAAMVSIPNVSRKQDAASPILIESIAERLDVKRAFFADCEKWMHDGVILATNTSTLPIESVAASMHDPSRLIGMHFFMPVQQREGVEVIASQFTAPDAIDVCCSHADRLGKVPFCVGDQPGFVVNRMLSPYINDALTLLCGGAAAEQIEQAALGVGMPMSPLELVDVIGARTAFDGGRVYWQAFPSRMTTSPLLPAMVKRGRLGRHVGKGFYNYDSDGVRSPTVAAEATELAARYGRDVREWTTEEISQRFEGVLREEAACILCDHVVPDMHVITTALRGGLGFHSDRWDDE